MNKNAKDAREKEKQQLKELLATGLADPQPLYGRLMRQVRTLVHPTDDARVDWNGTHAASSRGRFLARQFARRGSFRPRTRRLRAMYGNQWQLSPTLLH